MSDINRQEWIDTHPPEENNGETWDFFDKLEMNTWEKLADVMEKTAGRYNIKENDGNKIITIETIDYTIYTIDDIEYFNMLDTGGFETEKDLVRVVMVG